MRPSKTRSRHKSNRQRSLGNVVNRVFDSSGPEGKVRGTPQQIIEKYLTLARDAQLGSDRVAEQSFLQHAEHYTRLLGEAQREQAERQQQFQNNRGDADDGQRQNRDERQRDDQRRDSASQAEGQQRDNQQRQGGNRQQPDLAERTEAPARQQAETAGDGDDAFPQARDVNAEQAEETSSPEQASLDVVADTAPPARKTRSAAPRRTAAAGTAAPATRAPRTRRPAKEAEIRDPEPASDAASVE